MAVDLADFDPIVDRAMEAFASDSSYAVSMASKASAIIAKREVWTLRKELRHAEGRARALCSVSEIRVCGVSGPCGTGACPFASGDLKQLMPTSAKSGKPVARPVPSAVSHYNLETVIRPLVAMRSGRAGLAAVG